MVYNCLKQFVKIYFVILNIRKGFWKGSPQPEYFLLAGHTEHERSLTVPVPWVKSHPFMLH